jgi:hypothetical protein
MDAGVSVFMLRFSCGNDFSFFGGFDFFRQIRAVAFDRLDASATARKYQGRINTSFKLSMSVDGSREKSLSCISELGESYAQMGMEFFIPQC